MFLKLRIIKWRYDHYTVHVQLCPLSLNMLFVVEYSQNGLIYAVKLYK